MNKKVLLIGGGGTLGTYTAKELLKLGNAVDIICLEDKKSDNEKLRFFKAHADMDYLSEFLKDRYYDGIVNFIHYKSVEEYKPVHKLLTDRTGHLIFLSSYRVYANKQRPVTENASQLYDTVSDELFLTTEDYAVPKSKNEHYIREESGTTNWTIVRPVISFSAIRFDVVTESGKSIIDRAAAGISIKLPLATKDLTAGLDWAGNSGKLIANLLFKEYTFGEAYTVSTAQNLKWGEVADLYSELIGAKFEWVSTEEYLETRPDLKKNPWILKYDRLFDRYIDNTKILKATGLTNKDFVSVREGIKTELKNLKNKNGVSI